MLDKMVKGGIRVAIRTDSEDASPNGMFITEVGVQRLNLAGEGIPERPFGEISAEMWDSDQGFCAL